MPPTMIESVRIEGFRSLADVDISGLPQAAVFIGANGSGKSNFMRFFEMLSWMLTSRQLGEFIIKQGGADDQLFGGNAQTPRMSGEITMRTLRGYNDYRFALAYAHPDRFLFTQEDIRFNPVFPISGVFRLKGQPNRDNGMIFRSCKASQSPVYPIRDAILAVNHASCPSLSSSAPRQCGETALKTSRLPGALSLLAKSWLYPPSAWRRR